jgi:hypothetical protein
MLSIGRKKPRTRVVDPRRTDGASLWRWSFAIAVGDLSGVIDAGMGARGQLVIPDLCQQEFEGRLDELIHGCTIADRLCPRCRTLVPVDSNRLGAAVPAGDDVGLGHGRPAAAR